jgi:hypothetical protein
MENMRTRKKNKSKALIEAEKSMDLLLTRVGYTGKLAASYSNEMPDYRTDNHKHTSNKIPTHGPQKESMRYTGDEIAGIVTTHKSNLMPIRKDNMQAAVDAATMRRS